MQTLFRTKTVVALIIFAILILVWDAYLHLTPVKTGLVNYLYNVGYAVLYFWGTVVGLSSLRKLPATSTMGRAILFLSLGTASYGIGLLIWAYYNVVAHVEIPYPSIADIFFILGFIPAIGIGVVLVMRIYSSSITFRHFFEGSGIFLAACILTLGFISRPDVSLNLSLLNKITNIAYPLGDSILLTLAFVTLRIVGGKIHEGVRILVVGLLFQVIADFVYTYRTAHNFYWNGDIADLLYTVSATILSLAIIALVRQLTATPVTPVAPASKLA